ncbi:MAG: hypothetical protein AAF399_26810 [Bacteroidota bacterium]
MKSFYPTLSFFFLSLFSLPSFLLAQPSMGLHLQMAPKTVLLQNAGYQDSWGGNMEFFSPEYGKTRMGAFAFGMNGAFLGAGGHTEDVILQIPAGAEGTLRVGNRQAQLHAIARYLTPEARVRFYLDGLIGARWFGTTEIATITDLAPGYEDSDERNVISDWGLSYGAGIGSMIRLTQEVSLDLRATYLYRKEAQFANLSSASKRGGNLSYNYGSANPSQWFFQVGINIKLDDSGCSGPSSPPDPCCCCEQAADGGASNSGRILAPNSGGFSSPGRSIQAAPTTRVGKN